MNTDQQTTLNYQETPYQDEKYQIVGTPPSDDGFIPMAVGVINTNAAKTDHMFSDFGGSAAAGNESLWHLPQGVRYESEDNRKNAQELKELEQQQIEDQIAAAKAAGYEQGKKDGIAQAEELLKQRTEEMNTKVGTIIQDLVKQIREHLIQIEQDAAKLAMNIVEKIIPEAVEINPEYIIPILREALDLAGPSIIKKVRVSPADMEFINVVGLQKDLEQFDGTWEFVADDTIRGGCVVETSAGDVEYDLGKAWERMKENILKVVR